MKYLIYKTTNIINGKQYIGCHVTNDHNDDYFGSGKLLLKAIEKYGVENFHKEIIHECSNTEHMFIKEAEFVNADWVESQNTYNLKVGGEGGWDYINREKLRWNEEKKKLHSIEMKKKREAGLWGPKTTVAGFAGKKHTEESKRKISENNASTLDQKEYNKRLNDYNNIEKKRGYIKLLSQKWNVSHTQVRRFINRL